MKEVVCRLNDVEDISNFVKHASKVDGDVIVREGVYCVDGKSVLGMFALDPSLGFVVEYPESAKKFETYIKKFVVRKRGV